MDQTRFGGLDTVCNTVEQLTALHTIVIKLVSTADRLELPVAAVNSAVTKKKKQTFYKYS